MLNPNTNALPAAITGSTTNNVPAHLEEVKDAINNGSLLRRLSQAQIDALSGVTRPIGLIVENLTTGATQKWDGAKWVDLAVVPSYQAWSPAVSIAGVTCTPVTGECQYQVLGKRVTGTAAVTLSSVGAGTSDRVMLPLPVATRSLVGLGRVIGSCAWIGPAWTATPGLLLRSTLGAAFLQTEQSDAFLRSQTVAAFADSRTTIAWSFDYESA